MKPHDGLSHYKELIDVVPAKAAYFKYYDRLQK
jgi:hypothetical protein